MIKGPPRRRPRILIAADGAVPTGFARVVRAVFEPLAEAYDIAQLGVGYSGDPHDWPWPIYPAGQVGDDVWGAHRIAALAGELSPDLIFLLSDTWVVQRWLTALGPDKGAARRIAYVPVDGGPVHPKSVAAFDRMDRLFTYTDHARRALQEALGKCGAGFAAPEVAIMPHGVDSTMFYPVPQDEARARIFPANPELARAFIVLNANRNQPRKRIDLTIMGFAEFARDIPDARLFLHMGARDMGWDVPELARRFGIDDKVIMSTEGPAMPFVSTEHLNLIYNACDVGLNTSEAEGWGLVTHEHAATGAAQIVPDHTAYADIWGDAAIRLRPSFGLIDPASLTDAQLVAPADIAKALQRCYADRSYLQQMAERASAWARQPEFAWSALSARWSAVFQETLALEAKR